MTQYKKGKDSLFAQGNNRECVRIRYMLSYVVCNVRTPYSASWNFQQCFYGTLTIRRHLGKILQRSSQENSIEGLNARGVAEYSDFGPSEGCISETVQDRN